MYFFKFISSAQLSNIKLYLPAISEKFSAIIFISSSVISFANIDKESAFENYRRHDKYSPVLIGSIDRIKDKITKRNQKDTKSLKKVDEVIAKQGSIEDMLNI